MSCYRFSLLLLFVACLTLPSLAQSEEASDAPAPLVTPKHPAVKRLIFELTAEGYERRAALIQKGIAQDELSFLRLMYESYKVVDRAGLPSSYISYMDEMLAWIERDMPMLLKDKSADDSSALILSSYQEKLAELAQKYKIAHETLTSQNNEFRNLLDESGFSREITNYMSSKRDDFHRDPKKEVVDFYRYMAGRLRELAKSSSRAQ